MYLRYIFTMNKKIRYSGILLHPTSLPGQYGIGELGDEARSFVDILTESSVGLWQILPLGPVGFGNSPYAVRSAFAGNEFLISLDTLVDEGYLDFDDVVDTPHFPEDSVDFPQVEAFKFPLLVKAAKRFIVQDESDSPFKEFCENQKKWLDDYALYRAMLDHYGDSRWFEVWDKGPYQKR